MASGTKWHFWKSVRLYLIFISDVRSDEKRHLYFSLVNSLYSSRFEKTKKSDSDEIVHFLKAIVKIVFHLEHQKEEAIKYFQP